MGPQNQACASLNEANSMKSVRGCENVADDHGQGDTLLGVMNLMRPTLGLIVVRIEMAGSADGGEIDKLVLVLFLSSHLDDKYREQHVVQQVGRCMRFVMSGRRHDAMIPVVVHF
jgi:hypothetical protein